MDKNGQEIQLDLRMWFVQPSDNLSFFTILALDFQPLKMS